MSKAILGEWRERRLCPTLYGHETVICRCGREADRLRTIATEAEGCQVFRWQYACGVCAGKPT